MHAAKPIEPEALLSSVASLARLDRADSASSPALSEQRASAPSFPEIANGRAS